MSWEQVETAPHDVRVMVWTGHERYLAHWAQHPVTGDVAWIVCDLPDGTQALVRPTHWWNGPLPETPPESRED